jgi:hypothetical protein
MTTKELMALPNGTRVRLVKDLQTVSGIAVLMRPHTDGITRLAEMLNTGRVVGLPASFVAEVVDPAKAIRQLQRVAARSTRARGHRMQWQTVTASAARIVRNGGCRYCGMQVDLDTHPLPNGIDIGGEAVAVNCLRERS